MSGDELRRLVYMVSHDLQAPTRHIRSFVDLLIEELDGGLGEDAATFFELIVGAADELDSKLSGLTLYSRAINNEYEMEPCSGQAIVEAAIGRCDNALATSRADVTVGPLPTVQGDEEKLIDVVAELITNSVKFSTDTPEIDITGATDGHMAGLTVTDRSTSTPADDPESLFDLYRRAHPRSIPGTGCGLTIARAVIRAHGGELTIAGRDGGGVIARLVVPAHQTTDYTNGLAAAT